MKVASNQQNFDIPRRPQQLNHLTNLLGIGTGRAIFNLEQRRLRHPAYPAYTLYKELLSFQQNDDGSNDEWVQVISLEEVSNLHPPDSFGDPLPFTARK